MSSAESLIPEDLASLIVFMIVSIVPSPDCPLSETPRHSRESHNPYPVLTKTEHAVRTDNDRDEHVLGLRRGRSLEETT